ncbi:hypothetical protein [Desulfosporosinus lacus]|uniref:Uncharacterized protein n=1 Tax=Desulfosporosinus lacus DSM 15449 TaxID=1121420 RepID=A0A1M5Y0G2_9FIRM|nr:hypothetical protein [Desulfosporosinus lacus]SHI05551.1 hypothetical protein SAMN02746098_02172 [Desulfosporosinus lacus DSM 15449]
MSSAKLVVSRRVMEPTRNDNKCRLKIRSDVFNLSGMERKQDTEAVKVFVQLDGRQYFV